MAGFFVGMEYLTSYFASGSSPLFTLLGSNSLRSNSEPKQGQKHRAALAQQKRSLFPPNKKCYVTLMSGALVDKARVVFLSLAIL